MKRLFASRLKDFRLKSGLSLNELSKLTNISSSTLNKYETGKMIPKIDGLLKLCKTLKCSADQLLGNSKSTDFDPIVLECAEMIQSMGTFEREWLLLTIDGVKTKTQILKQSMKTKTSILESL